MTGSCYKKQKRKIKENFPNVSGWFVNGGHGWRVLSKSWMQHCWHTMEVWMSPEENNIPEYQYKCWHCSALVQFVNVPFAEQQLMFKLLCQAGIYFFLKNRYWSSVLVAMVGLWLSFTIFIDCEMFDLFSSECGCTDLLHKHMSSLLSLQKNLLY